MLSERKEIKLNRTGFEKGATDSVREKKIIYYSSTDSFKNKQKTDEKVKINLSQINTPKEVLQEAMSGKI